MTNKREISIKTVFLFGVYLSALVANIISASAVASEKSSEHMQKHKRPIFADIDLSGDGEISLDEFNTLTLPHGENEVVFNDIDEDDNGVISQSEFSSHKPPRPPRK